MELASLAFAARFKGTEHHKVRQEVKNLKDEQFGMNNQKTN